MGEVMRKFLILFVLIVTVPALAEAEVSTVRHNNLIGIVGFNQKDVHKYDAIANAVDNHDCDKILKLKKITLETVKSKRPLLAAELIERGICFEKNYEDVAYYLLEHLKVSKRDAYAMAKLGNLYWQGLGVNKDYLIAKDYFKISILYHGTEILKSSDDTSQSSAVKSYWGFTNEEKDWTFSSYEFGSWELPPPLIEELNWLRSLQNSTNAGKMAWLISQDLLVGSNSIPKNADLASAWMVLAAYQLDYAPIQIQAVKLLLDPQFKAERLKQFPDRSSTNFDIFMANGIIWQSIKKGNFEALEYAYCTVSRLKEEDINYTPLYLAGTLLKQKGILIDENRYADISNKVASVYKDNPYRYIDMGYHKNIGAFLPDDIAVCELK